jgi:transposase
MKFINLVINEGYSIAMASKELDISSDIGKRWVKVYEYHGEDGLKPKYNDGYDSKYRESALRYMQENKLSSQELFYYLGANGPSLTTVKRWITSFNAKNNKDVDMKKDNELPIEIASDATKDDLLKEVNYLRTEIAYLKKYNALVRKKNRLETKKKRR